MSNNSAKGASYVLPYSAARAFPHHGFTIQGVCYKRFWENASMLSVTVGFILPTLRGVNMRLEQHVTDATDVSMDETLKIFYECGQEAALMFADRLARVSCQTAMACALISSENAVADSTVFLWDLYPRLHQRYIGEVLSFLHIPRCFASLLGAAPGPSDIKFLEEKTNPIGAFEDCMKRHTIILVGDIVVDTARVLLSSSSKKAETITRSVIMRSATSVISAGGAAVGRGIGGDRGEYWGEILGLILAPALIIQATSNFRKIKSSKKHHSSKPSSARTHRRGSSSDVPSASAKATA